MGTKKPSDPMMRAALVMHAAGAYYCGGNDRWVFPGKYAAGCDMLVAAGLCEDGGLRVFSSTHASLTSSGSQTAKCVYRLNHKGKEAAETYKKARAPKEPPNDPSPHA